MDLIPGKEHFIESSDERKLGLLEYQPNTDTISGVILFPPAMGVKQHFYRYYCSFLVEQGYHVFSMDYSGIGLSKHGPLRGSGIGPMDWVEEINDVINWIDHNHRPEDLPFFYVTHSLGGQFFGLLSDNHKIDAMISVTSQNGYWRYYKTKYRYFFFWYLLAPAFYHLLGYFPSSKLGLGEDLPKRVAKKWKVWCTSENYFFDDPNIPTSSYSEYNGPILTLSFDDDPWATKEAVGSLVEHYSNAVIEHRHYDPQEFELDSIGHFGFFRPKSEEIWKITVEWLEGQ